MSTHPEKIRIHNFGEIAHFTAITLAATGISAGLVSAGLVTAPYLICGFAASITLKTLSKRSAKKEILEATVPLTKKILAREDGGEFFLEQTHAKARRLGLSDIENIRTSKEDGLMGLFEEFEECKEIPVIKKVKDSTIKILLKFPNAFLFTSNKNKDYYVVSRPLLNCLDDEEEIAVITHELGHKASAPPSFLPTDHLINSSKVSSLFALASTVITSPLAGGGAMLGGLAAGIVTGMTAMFCLKNASKRTRLMWGNSVSTLTTNAVMLGIPLLLGNPELVAAFLTFEGASFGAKLLSAAHSRKKEYQADRLSARATGNPMALATALEKISIDLENAPQFIEENDKKRTLWSGLLSSLYATHPPVEKRIARLEKMAAKMPAPKAMPINPAAPRKSQVLFP